MMRLLKIIHYHIINFKELKEIAEVKDILPELF